MGVVRSLEFLGQGADFPHEIKSDGSFALAKELQIVEASLRQILFTRIGERVMQPTFGSRLAELVFEPNDRVFQTLAVFMIRESVGRWEKRVSIDEIRFEYQDDTVLIDIRFRLVATSVPANVVIPFTRGVANPFEISTA